MSKTKVIAFHLPQFHAIKENDEWWGEGFTEWTNVKKAQPLFNNHNQPRVPASENFYNLLNPETQHWQAKLAADHGISGFCYYHYWFNGKMLLEKPAEMILERGTPEFPFCMAWANEPWTRVWDGGSKNVLMPQEYGQESDWEDHFQYLLRFFRDERYIKLDGKPVFLVYRTLSIEHFSEMASYWRRRAVDAGLPGLHIVSMLTVFEADTRPNHCDAFVEFEPMCSVMRLKPTSRRKEQVINYLTRLQWKYFGKSSRAPHSLDYRTLWEHIASKPSRPDHYPGAFVDWDNSPRKGLKGSLVLRNYDQKAFDQGFNTVYKKACSAGTPFMFINAWNEWAEGTYLEPDTKRGTACLESISRTVNGA